MNRTKSLIHLSFKICLLKWDKVSFNAAVHICYISTSTIDNWLCILKLFLRRKIPEALWTQLTVSNSKWRTVCSVHRVIKWSTRVAPNTACLSPSQWRQPQTKVQVYRQTRKIDWYCNPSCYTLLYILFKIWHTVFHF